MLTIPSVNPFLKTFLTDSPTTKNQSARIPHDSWQTIVQESITQRIAPLLLRWLSDPAHRHEIPLHWLDVLKQQVVQHAAWQLLLTQELRGILAACARRNIACVPIRGPVLAEGLYGDGLIRQMDDLDFLVHREDLTAVKDIFQQRGYAQHEQRPGFHETYSYSLELIHPHHGFIVEPHWTLSYPPFVDLAAMQPVWARARRQQWTGIDAWSLSHEDLLLHLCLHLHHKGQQAPLLWFYELDAVINRHGATLDWTVFLGQARLMEQTDAVADVLILLKNEFRSAVPDSVAEQLTEQRRNHSGTSSLIIRNQILARSVLNGREEFALLCSLHSFRQQLYYLFALLVPAPRYMMQRYGTSSRVGLIGVYLARIFTIGAEGLRCAITWISTLAATQPNSSIRQ